MSTSTVEVRLSEAWSFLAGQDFRFRRVEPPHETTAPPSEWQVFLPFTQDDHQSACRLTITDAQTRHVASTMFDVPEWSLTQADLDDAVREICNVLGSCLLEGRSGPGAPAIGLPLIVARDQQTPSELLSQYEPETCHHPQVDEIRTIIATTNQR